MRYSVGVQRARVARAQKTCRNLWTITLKPVSDRCHGAWQRWRDAGLLGSLFLCMVFCFSCGALAERANKSGDKVWYCRCRRWCYLPPSSMQVYHRCRRNNLFCFLLFDNDAMRRYFCSCSCRMPMARRWSVDRVMRFAVLVIIDLALSGFAVSMIESVLQIPYSTVLYTQESFKCWRGWRLQ